MLAPTSPSVASSRSGSMRRKRPPASRKFWIWEAALLTTRPPLVGRSPARDDPVLVDVEQPGQDPASHRRGGVRAEAPSPRPPFAIVAYATAICIGSTATSPCPTDRLTLSPTDQGRSVRCFL